MDRKESKHEGPEAAVMKMVNGYWVSQCISVIAELGIPDLIPKEEERSVVSHQILAQQSNTKPEYLLRVLRSLASVGFFTQDEQNRFGLTPLSECLRSDAPKSVRAMAIMAGKPFRYQPWGCLKDVLRTGESGMKLALGQEMYDYFEDHREDYRLFEQAMESSSKQIHAAILYAYNFAQELGKEDFKILDIGGGRGAMMADILQRFPKAHGELLDREFVTQEAEKYLNSVLPAGSVNQWSVTSGDFLDCIPSGADAYLLKNVIHDWSEEDSVTLLKNVAAAIRKAGHGRLLIIEHVIEEGDAFSFGKWLDVNMMVVTKGKDRTRHEYEELIARAGLKVQRVIKTLAPRSIIECVCEL